MGIRPTLAQALLISTLVFGACAQKTLPSPPPAVGKSTPARAPRALHRPAERSAAALVARLRRAVDGLKSYRAVLETRFRPSSRLRLGKRQDGLAVTTVLAVTRPSRMMMQIKSRGQGRRWSARLVYDGKVMLASMRQANKTQLLRLDQAKLAPAGGFDVGWSPSGHGLATGRDLVGTVHEMLRMFRFTRAPKTQSVGKRPCLELRGELDPRGAAAVLLDKPANLRSLVGPSGKLVPSKRIERFARSMSRMIRDIASAHVCVDPVTALPRRFAFDDAHVRITTIVSSLEPTAKHRAELFRHDKAKLAKARDLTASIQAALKGAKRLMTDAALRAAVLEALARELERPTPAPSPAGPIVLPAKKGP